MGSLHALSTHLLSIERFYIGYLNFTDLAVEVPGYGQITVDIVYGGAFYAIVPAGQYGLDIKESKVSDLREAAGATTGNEVFQCLV